MSTPGELVDSQDFFGNVSSDDTQNQGTGSSTEGDAAHQGQLSRCVSPILAYFHFVYLLVCITCGAQIQVNCCTNSDTHLV